MVCSDPFGRGKLRSSRTTGNVGNSYLGLTSGRSDRMTTRNPNVWTRRGLRPRDMPPLFQPTPGSSLRSRAAEWALEFGLRQETSPKAQVACAYAPRSAQAYDDR